jgi:methyl-accepting chemotaxis protein
MQNQRKQILVNTFQTRLFLRLAIYWLIYQLTVWNFLFLWEMIEDGTSNPLEHYVRFFQERYPTLICFVLLVPFLCWDAVKFAHRLVGPLYRFQKTMQAVAAGDKVPPVKLRQGDFLIEMQDDFNHMLTSIQERGVTVLETKEQEEERQAPVNA